MTKPCLTARRLDQVARGARATALELHHIESCAACRTELAACREDEGFIESHLRPALALPDETTDAALFFGPYSRCELIGRGGMASVYSACAPDGSAVAVKVCRHDDALPYFRREIRTMRRALERCVAGIPPLLDAAEDHIPAYLVTRFFPGGNLADRLAREGPLPVPRVLALAERLSQTLSGLSRLHVVHRDIKPSNILLDEHGEAWLADLGLAREYGDHIRTDDRLTSLCITVARPRSPPATVAYMSPEQAAGERLTPASDLFALGITLYEAATGVHPFAGRTVYQIASGIQRDQPPLPSSLARSLPDGLVDLIMACLDKDPARRPTPARIRGIVRHCKESRGLANTPVKAGGRPAQGPGSDTGGPRTMSTVASTIQQAAQFLRQNRFPVSPRLEQELAGLENPCYRIAVVGKYQVGKSTLINRVFIRDEVLLKEGEGLPTTAVTTEVTYGERKLLEVLNWETESVTSPDGSQSAEIRTGGIIAGDVIDEPTPADLARFTTADPAARLNLTERIAGVRLSWPCASLRRFTLLDTPGVDDPDRVLLANTTYRIIPQADAAILVVAPRMLDAPELQFLQSHVFAAGLTRLMVFVSYNPGAYSLSAEGRSDLLRTIRAQLAQIGRAYVPVRLICYDPLT